MSQKSPSGYHNTQSDFLPEAHDNNTQEETQDPLQITYRPKVSVQDPLPIIHNPQVIIQEASPIIHTRRVSIQEPPIIHTRRVSIQEPLSIIHTRRVSIQETPSISNSHLVSIQETPPIIHSRRVSIQETPPISNSRLVSIQESPSISNSHQVSTEDTPSIINSHWASIQDTPSATYSCRFNTQDVSSVFQTRHFSVQSTPLITHIPLTNGESVAYTSQFSFQDHPPTTSSLYSSIQGPTSSEDFKDTLDSFQSNEYTLDSNSHSLWSGNSVEANSGRFQDRCRHTLPVGRWLLYEAKKISHQLSLLLSLVGMVIISLITLGQPWIHFHVPLTPPGDPAGPLTIPIDTIFFVRCPDVSCLHEYNQNAYFLDFAWASLLFASITSFCLCSILINIIFCTSSNLPMLDFSNVIISTLTGMALRFFLQEHRGTSMILGILFYLMQANEFLQEGMTYRLGHSFYLAWIGVFFFLMTGFFSYLNYMNFWSILAIQAIWT